MHLRLCSLIDIDKSLTSRNFVPKNDIYFKKENDSMRSNEPFTVGLVFYFIF